MPKDYEFIKGESSGKTQVRIFPDRVEKIYPQSSNISLEIEVLSKIKNKHIINMLYFEDNKIVYEKLDTIIDNNFRQFFFMGKQEIEILSYRKK